MGQELHYGLADSTVIEPLIGQWSAWATLVSPVAASLHLADFQVFALTSYLVDPAAHVRASRDPELIGGPFVDIAPDRAEEVRELLARTVALRASDLTFARAVKEFHNRIVDEAKGQSLEPYYRTTPDELRGYVELVYDYYHRPTVRFIEGLLYESEHYRRELQSLRLWRLERDASRPFFMSTPRLPEQGQLDWQVPFDDARVDELFALDSCPRPLGAIREMLGLNGEAERLLPAFLSAETAPPPPAWEGETPRVRYFGHACILIEWRGVSILTDPFVGAVPTAGGMQRLTYRDLPAKIDYALVTHNHQDHFALETLLRLRHRIGHLVVPRNQGSLYGDVSLRLLTRKLGFRRVIEMDALDSIELPGGEIVAVPFLGEHGDLAHSKSAYVVRAGRVKMLVGADSDCLEREVYVRLRRTLGEIDTVFLGTESVGAPLSWGAGALFPHKLPRSYEQSRRYHGSDARSAVDILRTVGARRLYNYAMGIEPWVEHLLGLGMSEDSPQYVESEKLLAHARRHGFLAAERLSGKAELFLEDCSGNACVPVPELAADDDNIPVTLDYQGSRDAEDQFTF
jgi:L-ascorbate metabolism protein UlaG (beta-lactamase superfamily)